MNAASSPVKQKKFNGSLPLLALLLGGTLAVLCHEGFRPYEVFWANDLPLGALAASSNRLPGAFFACWTDYYWIGGPGIVSLNLSNICMGLFSPAYHLKFYAPGTMFFLGFSAWFFFRQLRFAPAVCILGGLAAGLNMHFFSNACWGLGQWNVCCAMIFIALGILASPGIRSLWLKAVLAGFSTGMAVMEGFDVGAIMSVYVGVFVAFTYLTMEGKPSLRAGRTLLAGGLVVLAAVLISLSTIFTLVLTQIKGTGADESGQVTQQTDEQRTMRWQFITQWSIPKLETLRVIVPGLFGYRMQEFTTSTNKAGAYWGKIAEDPHIQGLESGDAGERSHAAAELGLPKGAQDAAASGDPRTRQNLLEAVKPQLQRRHTGNGEYAGIMVCLLAAFGLANSWRKAGSDCSPEERRAVWFWGGAALFSLLAAWGRYGFVYRLVYAMPFLTNIRSPMKFMHPLNISLIILAGYGMEMLHRRCLSAPAEPPGSLFKHWRKWWQKAGGFEVKWIFASGLAVAAAVAGFFIVRSSEPAIVNYLEHNGFTADLAPQIARFCDGEIGMFAAFLAVSAAVLDIILSGAWAGRRANLAWGLLGVIIICDLARSDIPWIRYYNYKEKLSPNPVVEYLREKPWEHRVVSRISPVGTAYDLGGTNQENINFGGLCHWWLENDYPYHDIESLEIDQAPRMPTIDSAYIGNFTGNSPTNPNPAIRLWQLTNTRYIFGDSQLTPALNFLGVPRDSFRTIMNVSIVPKVDYSQVQDGGDLTVKSNSQGTLALIEFTRALPRAKLCANWQVMNETNALRTLISPAFDPEKSVLVDQGTPVSQAPGPMGADAGKVEITRYAPTDLILHADARTPAVLLLNDHTGDYWNVWLDQKPAPILRCNYIMQGVFVPAGTHTVEFRYQPPRKLLYVSLAAFAAAILLGGYAMAARFMERPGSEPPLKTPKPKPK
ncbi:MAG TPA: hypothetical protein VGO59_12675 [Verrucomicrobiae bacterium]